MAVLVTDYQKKQNSKGGNFMVLTVEGGIIMQKNQQTGSWVAQALRTNIIANLDEKSCKALVGKSLPGTVIKKFVAPYTFRMANGDERVLNYKYEYMNDDEDSSELSFD